jgi:hypothetical protein
MQRWHVILLLLLCFALPAQAQQQDKPVRIAILLDDLGYNRSNGERALQLPGAVSVAIIPFTPHARALAQTASRQGRDVLIHMPMESTDPLRRLDQGGISLAQDETEVRQRVNAALRAVPNAIGMNNHMGSQITIDPVIMGWVMDEVKNTPLFYIDSVTNAATVAEQTAHRYHIPSIRRDVFLDNRTDPDAIDRQFQRLLGIARKKGYAVAIGHPHGATLRYLEQTLPTLQQQGIELVAISDLTARFGQPVDQPIRLQDLMRLIIAMPAPAASHLNFTN